MKKYEIMYILASTLEEAARNDEIAKLQSILVEKCHAKVTDKKEWGVRDFASVIKKQTKGYYVVLKVSAEEGSLNEFERLVKLDNKVIRHLIIVDPEE